jgi:hypothetical protein
VPHLRPPASSHGTSSFLWALGLGLFIFVGMLAISISMATSLIVAIVCGTLIFFFVRLFGDDTPFRQRSPRRSGGR